MYLRDTGLELDSDEVRVKACYDTVNESCARADKVVVGTDPDLVNSKSILAKVLGILVSS